MTYVSSDPPSRWHCKSSCDFRPEFPMNVYDFFFLQSAVRMCLEFEFLTSEQALTQCRFCSFYIWWFQFSCDHENCLIWPFSCIFRDLDVLQPDKMLDDDTEYDWQILSTEFLSFLPCKSKKLLGGIFSSLLLSVLKFLNKNLVTVTLMCLIKILKISLEIYLLLKLW